MIDRSGIKGVVYIWMAKNPAESLRGPSFGESLLKIILSDMYKSID